MSSSRRARHRRQQQSLRRHQLRVEGLEKRYALDGSSFVGPEGWGWIGVSANTQIKAVAEDSTGAVYLAGTFSGTVDVDFSATNYDLTSNGLDDAFVAKYTEQGGFVWAKSFGSLGKDRGYTLAIASDDSIRLGGFFSETVDFDPGAGTNFLTSAGAGDGFVLALDSAGNYQWAGQFGGTGTSWANGDGDFVNAVVVDGTGNTLVGGVMHYSATASFGGETAEVIGSGMQNSIIMKIDDEGVLQWTKHFNSSFLNGVGHIAVAPNDDVIVGGGLHTQTMDADPGPGFVGLTNAGVADAYIVALDSEGDYRWGYSYGSTAEESTGGVTTDSLGNVYMAAGLGGTQDLDPGVGEVPFTADGNQDLTVISFDTDGIFRWAETFGGTGSAGGHRLIFDGSGDLVVSGTYETSLTMPDGTTVSNLVSNGLFDNFVLWLDPQNGSPQRAINIGTSGNENQTGTVAQSGSNGLLIGGTLGRGGSFLVNPEGWDFLTDDGPVLTVPSGGGGYLTRLVGEPTNNPPSNVTLTDAVNTILETADTSSAIRIAGIDVTDDELGSNIVTLSGPDASSFYYTAGFGGAFGGGFAQGGVYLNPGIELDAASKPSFQFTVEVSDTSLPGSDPVTVDHTLTVLNVNDLPTGSVTIAGTPREDEVLTASNTLADADGLGAIGYQWKRDTVAISGATNSTYTLVQPDVGAVITVTASYTDQGGTNESVTSAATATIVSSVSTFTHSFDLRSGPDILPLQVSNAQIYREAFSPNNYYWAPSSLNQWSEVIYKFDLPLIVDTVDRLPAMDIYNANASVNFDNAAEGFLDVSADGINWTTVYGSTSSQGVTQPNDPSTVLAGTDTIYLRARLFATRNFSVNNVEYAQFLRSRPEQANFQTLEVSGSPIPSNSTPTGSVTIAGTAREDEVFTASNTLADADGLGTISYQWKRDAVAISGATNSAYTLVQADVGAAITVTASYTDQGGTDESVTSTATTVVVNVNDLPTGSVTIAGTAREDEVLTASNTLADADGLGATSYQWKRDTVTISGATNSTYTLVQADVGSTITVTVSYTDQGGTNESVTSTGTASVIASESAVLSLDYLVLQANQAGSTVDIDDIVVRNLSTNTIEYAYDFNSGDLTDVQLLHTTDGTSAWEFDSSMTRIVNGKLRLESTGFNQNGSGGYDSRSRMAINRQLPPSFEIQFSVNKLQWAGHFFCGIVDASYDHSPVNDGNYQFLSRQSGGVAPVDNTPWVKVDGVLDQIRTGSTLSGLNGSDAEYRIVRQGTELSIYINSTRIGYASDLPDVSSSTNSTPIGSVTITGTAREDEVLTANNTLADADGLGVVSYQWKRDAVAISGATNSTYTLVQADVGAAITVTTSYTDQGGTNESVTSAATTVVVNVNDLPTGSVTITGTAREDEVLTASNTLADADGLGTISYQWKRDAVAISGATNSAYTLVQADVGAAITVTASYTDQGGTNESVTSAATTVVVNVNDLPTGSVTITGTAREDEVLTASNTLADADGLGTISYQWKRDAVAISGATNSAYTLVQADVGAAITVTASYTDQGGTNESVTSAATTVVVNVNDLPTGSVTITGTAREDEVLTASNTLADADGLGAISYQWKRDAVAISGATSSSLHTRAG